jgi:hypothetical protein
MMVRFLQRVHLRLQFFDVDLLSRAKRALGVAVLGATALGGVSGKVGEEREREGEGSLIRWLRGQGFSMMVTGTLDIPS